MALRDATGDGRADLITRYSEWGGTGISLYAGYLYFADYFGWRGPAEPDTSQP